MQTAVAVLVAILGIVNALTVSITDRRRELGVLQAVGGLRNQIRHTIWMEAIAIGIIGVVLGLALGAVQLFYSIEIARRDLVGISISLRVSFPDRADPDSGDSGIGIAGRAGSGGERGARIADRGIGV